MNRRAFSFTEILFAIMILGIGFIMVAAMFPAAIRQTGQSKDETVGAEQGRAGIAFVEQMSPSYGGKVYFRQKAGGDLLCPLRPTVAFPGLNVVTAQDLFDATKSSNPSIVGSMPPIYLTVPGLHVIPGQVWDFQPVPNNIGEEPVVQFGDQTYATPTNLRSVLWSMASENVFQTAAPRYGCVLLYRRDLLLEVTAGGRATVQFSNLAQVIIIATACRGKPEYDASDVPKSGAPAATPPSLQASRSTPGMPATISPASSGLDMSISFADPVQSARAAEDAFVVIADDLLPSTDPSHGQLNGRIYRLGNFDGQRWSFAPGYAPSPSDTNSLGSGRFTVYIVGRGTNPDGATPAYSGLAQDIAAYSTFVGCPGY